MIKLDSISKEYCVGEFTVKALQNLTFSINRGEFVAIMGSSGSGKSTLMNILGCLDSASGGNYWLNGVNVLDYDDNALSRLRNEEIGFVFQSFNLLPRLSALENVSLPMIYKGVRQKDRRRRAMDLLRKVSIEHRFNHRPNQMSGGQVQRVAIARALANNPSIILADEPTGNLDSQTTKEIMGIFTRLHREGNTIIIVTHDKFVAQFAKRIIKLRDGIIESDLIV
ncbi:MAG: ABC transporter ATP-binding protein [Bacteroidales bacterium]|nr:ABC transporter ATP-binding protein [Bacteroidales bacterium]